MTRVVRLTNPAAFDQDEVRALFTKAMDMYPIPKFETVEPLFRNAVNDPLVAIFIGAEKGKLKGLSIGCLPRDVLTPYPSVYHFYNSGSAKLREALMKETVDFFLEAGYTRFWAVNIVTDNDEAYKRLFKSVGEIRKLASLMEFDIG